MNPAHSTECNDSSRYIYFEFWNKISFLRLWEFEFDEDFPFYLHEEIQKEEVWVSWDGKRFQVRFVVIVYKSVVLCSKLMSKVNFAFVLN